MEKKSERVFFYFNEKQQKKSEREKGNVQRKGPKNIVTRKDGNGG